MFFIKNDEIYYKSLLKDVYKACFDEKNKIKKFEKCSLNILIESEISDKFEINFDYYQDIEINFVKSSFDSKILNFPSKLYLFKLEEYINSKILKSLEMSLLNAVICDNYVITEILIKNKANINSQNNDGFTPLTISVINQNKEIFDLLMKNKADSKIPDLDGDLPLHYAAAQNDLYFVDCLVKDGCDITAKNKTGITPKDYLNKFKNKIN